MNIQFNSAMKKATIGFAAAAVVLLIVACLLFKPSTGFFWVSALFLFFGYAAIYATVMFYLSDGTKAFKEFPANYPLIHVAIEYSVVQVVLVIVVVIINALAPNGVSLRIYFALELLLLLIYAIRYSVYNAGRKVSVELETRTNAKVMSIRMMTENCSQVQRMVKELPADVQTEAARVIRTMEEKVKYSDPMSHESLANIEYDIEKGIGEVADEVQFMIAEKVSDLTTLRRKVGKVNDLIDSRNNRTKMLK